MNSSTMPRMTLVARFQSPDSRILLNASRRLRGDRSMESDAAFNSRFLRFSSETW